MATPAMPYYIYCSKCGWEKYQRKLDCMPTSKEIEIAEKHRHKSHLCPKCGNDFLDLKPAKGLKAKFDGLFWF